MADVARLLPRHWDGQRLLRFLTGLALLALAFAAHAGLTAATAPAPATTVTTTVDVPAPDPAADVPAPGPAADLPALDPAADLAVVIPAGVTVAAEFAPVSDGAVRDTVAVPAGTGPGAHGSRGPPLI